MVRSRLTFGESLFRATALSRFHHIANFRSGCERAGAHRSLLVTRSRHGRRRAACSRDRTRGLSRQAPSQFDRATRWLDTRGARRCQHASHDDRVALVRICSPQAKAAASHGTSDERLRMRPGTCNARRSRRKHAAGSRRGRMVVTPPARRAGRRAVACPPLESGRSKFPWTIRHLPMRGRRPEITPNGIHPVPISAIGRTAGFG